MNTWHFLLLNLQGAMWASVWTFQQSHNVNLTYCLKSSLLLAFSFLFVWLIKLKYTSHPSHHQDCFRGSYVILRSWKGRLWSSEILGELRPFFIRWPKQPNPPPNGYIVTLIKFIHTKVSTCFLCGEKFYHQGYPDAPRDLIVMETCFYLPCSRERTLSNEFSNDLLMFICIYFCTWSLLCTSTCLNRTIG